MRILPVVVAAALAAACAFSLAAEGRSGAGTTLVELRQSARCTEGVTVAHAGGTVVTSSLGLYLVPTSAAGRLFRTLRARGAFQLATPNRPAGTLSVSDFSDPLVTTEW